MSKNFSLKEMIASDTAKRKGIDNTPSFEVVSHLNELCDNLLQPLRDAWGKAINVTSGYRCDALNDAVGGSKTSVHRLGYAADLQSGDFDTFVKFVVAWLAKTQIPFDQLLIEDNGKSRWLHISLYSNNGKQRKQILTI